ncbi:MAG: MaoC family dehydratase [Rhodospirillales bacterium]
MTEKAGRGNFFEDFRLGQRMVHAAPRTVTTGDTALYTALYGGRFPLHCSDETARAMGFPCAPVDDLLVFHIIFGKSVADVSLNAVANLGYAEAAFLEPVRPGDTLSAVSDVIGLKQNASGKTGVVYVRTSGVNQNGAEVLRFIRWVMVKKRDESAPAPKTHVPEPAAAAPPAALAVPAGLRLDAWDGAASGSAFRFGDYAPGERIDHVDGVTVEEAEHMLAARLYQNPARVHFNQHAEGEGRFGRRIVYGGHIISLARALSFNGLGAAFKIAAINGGRHTAPVFAGDTIYAWSEVLEAHDLPGRSDVGALRLRTVACKNRPAADFPGGAGPGENPGENTVLDLDYTVFMPK